MNYVFEAVFDTLNMESTERPLMLLRSNENRRLSAAPDLMVKAPSLIVHKRLGMYAKLMYHLSVWSHF